MSSFSQAEEETPTPTTPTTGNATHNSHSTGRWRGRRDEFEAEPRKVAGGLRGCEFFALRRAGPLSVGWAVPTEPPAIVVGTAHPTKIHSLSACRMLKFRLQPVTFEGRGGRGQVGYTLEEM